MTYNDDNENNKWVTQEQREERRAAEQARKDYEFAAAIANAQAANAVNRTRERAEQAVRDAKYAAEQAGYVERNNERLAAMSSKKELELKNKARAEYCAGGGSPQAFENAWPEILKGLLRDGTIDKMKRKSTTGITGRF